MSEALVVSSAASLVGMTAGLTLGVDALHYVSASLLGLGPVATKLIGDLYTQRLDDQQPPADQRRWRRREPPLG